MRRVLICGSNGLLGQRLAVMLGTRTEYEVLNTSHHRSFVFDHRLFDFTQLDLTRKGDVKSLISSFQPIQDWVQKGVRAWQQKNLSPSNGP